jgi:hypothetical protein
LRLWVGLGSQKNRDKENKMGFSEGTKRTRKKNRRQEEKTKESERP